MKLLNAILAATAAEASLAGAVLGLAALAGFASGWLDVLAQLAPVWFLLSLAGGGLALAVIEAGVSKVVVLALAAIGLASSTWLMAPEAARAVVAATSRPAIDAPPLKLLTFNAWSDNIDPAGSVDAILRADPDVVALQETAGLPPDERRRLRAAYPYWETCRPLACDLIVMSKLPWTDTGSQLLTTRHGLFVMMWASTLAPDGRPFTLATTHYAWPFPPGLQAEQRAALANAIHRLPPSDLVLTGDFNLTPWSAALRGQDAALAPLTRRTRMIFTWPANIAILKKPAPFPILPIDQIYAGPSWRTLAVQRLPRSGSDHYPVLIRLDRSPPPG